VAKEPNSTKGGYLWVTTSCLLQDVDALVLIVRNCIETTPPMSKSWSDSDKDTLKDVVESSMGMHNEIVSIF
jgi:hypothetical protein